DGEDDRAGDGQEGGDHHGGPGELAAPALHAGHVLGPAVTPAAQQRDDALAPQPARPPEERIELYQPEEGGQQHHDQRPVPLGARAAAATSASVPPFSSSSPPGWVPTRDARNGRVAK